MTSLREKLIHAGYTTDAVLERIGPVGQEGLTRNSTVPAAEQLGTEVVDQLIRLFLLQYSVASNELPSDLLGQLEAYGLVRIQGDVVTAVLDIRPYGSPDDGADGYLISDLTPGLDGQPVSVTDDYVLGASPASLTLTQITARTPMGSVLDLGTGCGVQSLHLAQHCERVVGTDLNPRAVKLARLGAELSDVSLDVREGSLFDPVQGETFDLIVSNPPYVMAPPSDAHLTYREGGFEADGLTASIVREAPRHLAANGSLQLLTNWAIMRGQNWEDRLASWVAGSGCDLWAIERERLDRFAYIEMWLTDAGLAGTGQWLPAYRTWLRYFEEQGIEEVGMGWLQITKAQRDEPFIHCESWPHAVAQPVGEVFARRRQAVDAYLLDDHQLLALAPRLADTQQETTGLPGASDPQHIVLRQTTGLLRGMKLSTITGAVLGALDGELTVRAVLEAVAQVLEIERQQVDDECLPVIRQALLEQYLLPC